MKSIIFVFLALLVPSQAISSQNDHKKLKDRCFDSNRGFRYEKSQNCHDVGDLYYEGGSRWEKSRYRDLSPPKSYSKAIIYFKQACEQEYGLSQSCNKVSDMYLNGEGVNRNIRKAFEYAEKSCYMLGRGNKESRGSKGCKVAASMYANGKGVEANDHLAAKMYLIECKFNISTAGCKQALMYGTYACNNGSVDGCVLVSDMYKELQLKYFDKANINNAPNKSNEYLKRSCELKSTRGCVNVALNYLDKKGVKQDYAKAIKYLKKACKGSPSYMCAPLSGMLLAGKNVKKDLKAALKYAAIGCKHAEGNSCAILGVQYAKGEGVTQSYKTALKHFKKGCKYGSSGSCNFVMKMHINGDGTSVNRKVALEYLIKACKTAGRYRKQDCETLTDKQLPKVN